jgi:hypothetical protein
MTIDGLLEQMNRMVPSDRPHQDDGGDQPPPPRQRNGCWTAHLEGRVSYLSSRAGAPAILTATCRHAAEVVYGPCRNEVRRQSAFIYYPALYHRRFKVIQSYASPGLQEIFLPV